MREGDRKTEGRIALDDPAARAPGGRPRWSMLVMGERGVFTFALPDTGAVTIGRAERCEVLVADPQLSREHARITIGDEVHITDLGSFNGTRLGGRQLAPNEPAVLAPGEVVSLGSTVLVLQPRAEPRARRLVSHAYFESRLDEECARAEERRGTFAVVRLRFDARTPTATIEPLLSATLDRAYVVGSYAPGEYEVLMTDVTPVDAERDARALDARLETNGLAPEVGIACYPRDGLTPEALLARAGRRKAQEVDATTALPPGGALERLRPIVERLAAGTIPVLVLGETGAGKDVLASLLHRVSPRANGPLVCINCAAVPEALFESELFGYERGAFTGATTAKAGLLESARGGTVFLDEVGEMPLALQAKLLRVLDRGEVMRLGATRPRAIDVRFVVATNRDLEAEVERGRFREDLFFRLAAAAIVVPPLRERTSEIGPLATAFVAQAARDLGRPRAPRIRAEAMALLEHHTWPGNVRELRNAMERAVLLAADGDIGLEQLPQEQMGRRLRASTPLEAPRTHGVETIPPTARPSTAPPHVNARVAEALARDPEAARLLAALEACDWNQTKAATELGISRRTLVTRLTTYGLTRRRGR